MSSNSPGYNKPFIEVITETLSQSFHRKRLAERDSFRAAFCTAFSQALLSRAFFLVK